MRQLEFLLFLIISALGLLLAFAAGVKGGPEAAGATGRASLSLAAASPSVQSVVTLWTTSPDVTTTTEVALTPPEPLEESPAPTLLTTDLPMLPQAQARLTSADTAFVPPEIPKEVTAPKPPEPEKAKVRPKQKPKQKTPASSAPPKRLTDPSTAQQKQKAQGTGAGNSAGRAQKAVPASKNTGGQASLEKQWGASIHNKIERSKRYPTAAAGQTGRVRLRITVARNGRLRNVVILRSSGIKILDRAALNAVRRAGRFARAPKGVTQQAHSFNVTLNFGQ